MERRMFQLNTIAPSTYDLKPDLQTVKDVIRATTDTSIPMVRNCIGTLLDSSGKMLRPTFLILSSRIGTIDSERMYKLAAGIELIHMASLIHDDIIDNSPTRRHKPTLHTIYGKRAAVLVGDFLFAKSFSIFAENSSVDNAASMTRMMERICEGEIQQDFPMYTDEISMRTYKRRITAKTALLFCLSFHLGAVESGCGPELSGILRRIGYNIGMSFQIIDDILDYTGSEKNLGKPNGNDLREGIYTAPLICALESGNTTLKSLISRRTYTGRRINRIIELTDKLGGIQTARAIAARYTERAVREIEKLPGGSSREMLMTITTNLLTREY